MTLVLTVEDEEHLRATLDYNLRKADYAVQSAASGPEALARFEAARPDLVLLDVMIPGFDGFEVCRRIRQLSSVPILMLTARADEVDTIVGLELGADDYIAKPFRMRELLAAAIALALAVLIARRTTRPLLDLRAMAGQFAGGDLTVQVPIPPGEEAAALAQDFNLMASRLRQVLAAAETERLATILATMADGILLLGHGELVTLVNHTAAHLLPMSSQALPVALAALPIGSALLPAVRAIDRQPSDSQPIVVDEVVVPATQRSQRAVVTRVPAPAQGQTLVVLQDLTELRRAEQTRRAFLANISHDLRTPITSLQAMIETLQDGALDDRVAAEDFLRRMDDEVQGLNRLVREFLELTQIESGQQAIVPSPTDLRVYIASVAARMSAQAQQHGVPIELAPPASLPVVDIDAARITQVLLNLLQNALTFTPRGGAITLGAGLQHEHVAVWVRDTGTGIPPADLPHVFERFYKADRARSGGGTGLGLAIAKHLVERHGGQIWAESQLGQGTTITFTLPLGAGVPAAER